MYGRDRGSDLNPCDACGACCREAFDSVPVGPEDERVAERYPELIRVHDDGWRDLKRVPVGERFRSEAEGGGRFVGRSNGTKCICLRGNGADDEPFRCTIYVDRPTNCRELEAGSDNCTLARERVGLPPLPTA